jgi:cytoskeletal protein RodZ
VIETSGRLSRMVMIPRPLPPKGGQHQFEQVGKEREKEKEKKKKRIAALVWVVVILSGAQRGLQTKHWRGPPNS